MSILDNIEDPNYLGSIFSAFGPSSAAAADNPPPPSAPLPPPTVMAGGPATFGTGPDPGSSVLAPKPAPTLASTPLGPTPWPSPAAKADAGYLMERYPEGSPGDIARTADITARVPTGAAPGAAPAPGPAAPPPRNVAVGPEALGGVPAPLPPGGAPTAGMPQGGVGLAQALGLPNTGYMRKYVDAMMSPEGQQRNLWKSALAGIGKGLENVGKMPAGASGGAMFAAGAGGGLTGNINEQTVQDREKVNAMNTLFNQTSTNFKDALALGGAVDKAKLSEAHARYYDALGAMRANGVKGSNAWQGTPYGQAVELEKAVDARRKQLELALDRKYKFLPPASAEEYDADFKKIEEAVAKYRSERAQRLGINPNEINRGTTREQAFDWDKLTPQQRLLMPDNTWYRFKSPGAKDADKDGYVYRQRDWLKTPPYPEYAPQNQAPAAPAGAPVPGTTAGLPSPIDMEREGTDILGS